MPLRMNSQIWSHLQPYAGRMCPAGSPSNRGSRIGSPPWSGVLAGPRSGLSSWPLSHYLECTGSSLSPLYWAGCTIVPFARTATKRNHTFSVDGPPMLEWATFGTALVPRVNSDSFKAHLKTVLFSSARLGHSWIVTLRGCYINLHNEWMNLSVAVPQSWTDWENNQHRHLELLNIET